MRKLHSVLVVAALAACTTTPIHQGGSAEIVFARNEMIRIQWDPQRTNERSMRSRAVAFCGGRDVEVLDTSAETGASGSLQSRTWRCEPFSGTGSGM